MTIPVDNTWVIEFLNFALELWNDTLEEVYALLSTSPEDFKSGTIWSVMVNINQALQAAALALLVLFFVIGLVQTSSSYLDVKKPEHVVKHFIRFALTELAITESMELVNALFSIYQGIISSIMGTTGISVPDLAELPDTVTEAIDELGFFMSIPVWIVAILALLVITVNAFLILITVYGRFFRIYMYAALAPIPLASFGAEGSQHTGISFIRSFCGVLLEGAVILLACIIYSSFAAAPAVNTDVGTAMQVYIYMAELIFNMMILTATVQGSDRVIREMMGL